jgi:hypothetical protein
MKLKQCASLGGAALVLTGAAFVTTASPASANDVFKCSSVISYPRSCLWYQGNGRSVNVLDGVIETAGSGLCGQYVLNLDENTPQGPKTSTTRSNNVCVGANASVHYRWKTNVQVAPTVYRMCGAFDMGPAGLIGWGCMDF